MEGCKRLGRGWEGTVGWVGENVEEETHTHTHTHTHSHTFNKRRLQPFPPRVIGLGRGLAVVGLLAHIPLFGAGVWASFFRENVDNRRGSPWIGRRADPAGEIGVTMD